MRDVPSFPPKETMVRQLKKIREEKDIQQKTVAEEMGIPASQLSKLENKGGNPTYETVFKVWSVLMDKVGGRESRTAEEIICRSDEYELTFIDPDATVKETAEIFCENNFSQAPVGDEENLKGSITEKTLMHSEKNERIEDIMDPVFPEVRLDTNLHVIRSILDYEYAVIVKNEKGDVKDLITRWDIVNELRVD
ncbi:helix-turn-helix domain-containing protein [Nanohaloarchaea archaeon]|nr:helix-turn-helix domain-containing protein [Candidatus Nanohaloarchaea archaeon]